MLIPAVIAQIFNHITELIIPIEIPTKEAKAEIEIHLVTTEAKIRNKSFCFIYIFHFKFLAYVFFSHIFKVYFQLNHEFLISQLILFFEYLFIVILTLTANTRKE